MKGVILARGTGSRLQPLKMQGLRALRYVFLEIQAPIGFKLVYFFEKLLKYAVYRMNACVETKLPSPYLFRNDYILRNKNGIWKIKHHSDYNFIVNTNYEEELEPHFNCSDGIFVDVGAHIGKWSIYIAKKSPESCVYALEPNPSTFAYLTENIRLNGLNNVKPLNIGLSSSKGTLDFVSEREYSGKSRIVTDQLEADSESIKVPVADFDSLADVRGIDPAKIKLIKIDVEGHEFEVLLGMRRTLRALPAAATVICEILGNQEEKRAILRKMRELGFAHRPLQTGSDFLFWRTQDSKPSILHEQQFEPTFPVAPS